MRVRWPSRRSKNARARAHVRERAREGVRERACEVRRDIYLCVGIVARGLELASLDKETATTETLAKREVPEWMRALEVARTKHAQSAARAHAFSSRYERYQKPSQHWPTSDLCCWIRGWVSFAPRLLALGAPIAPVAGAWSDWRGAGVTRQVQKFTATAPIHTSCKKIESQVAHTPVNKRWLSQTVPHSFAGRGLRGCNGVAPADAGFPMSVQVAGLKLARASRPANSRNGTP